MNILVEKDTSVVAYVFADYEIAVDNLILDGTLIITRYRELFNLVCLESQAVPENFYYGSHLYVDGKFIPNPSSEKYKDMGIRVTDLQNSIAENFIDHEFRISNIELGL